MFYYPAKGINNLKFSLFPLTILHCEISTREFGIRLDDSVSLELAVDALSNGSRYCS